MKILLKRTLVAAIAATALTVGMVGTANAGAKAFAHLQIDDFIITHGNGDQYDAGDFDTLLVGNNSSTFAIGTFNGIPTPVAQSGVVDNIAGASVVDNHSCVGTGCAGIGEDNYTQQAPPLPGTGFVRSDTQLLGAIITGLPGVPGSVTADSLSEGQTNVTGDGRANSSVGTLTQFSFSLGADDTMTFDFSADGSLHVLLHQDDVDVFAATEFSITIRDTLDDSVVFNYAPGPINTSIGLTLEGDSLVIPVAAGPYSSTTGVLSADKEYRLTINQGTRITFDAVKDVPEPATLALFGLGLLGVGAARFSRKNKKLV